MSLWMMWSLLVGSTAAVGAWALDRLLVSRDRPARWVWLGALSWTLALVAWAALRRPYSPSLPLAATAPRGETNTAGEPQAAGLDAWLTGAVEPLLGWMDAVAPVLWAMTTGVGLALLSGGVLLLSARIRRWGRARVEGEVVALSEDFGPALVGVWHPTIVLPRWILALGDRDRRLAVRHEVEHRDAHDTLLLSVGTLLTVLMPWNPAVWFMSRRLRQAVELDCDRRVLDAGFPAAEYGSLLIELSAGSPRSGLFVAAMTQPTSLLERRLTMMTKKTKGVSQRRTACGLILAAGAFLMACESPPPSMLAPDAEPGPADAAAVVGALDRVSEGDRAQPLVYVDGVRVPHSELGAIDTDDIERIEVLKGDAALSLVGEEVAGGVVQVFLKKDPGQETAKMRLRGPAAGVDAALQGRDGEPAGPTRRRKPAPEPDWTRVKLFVDGERAWSLDGIHPEDVERMDVVGGESGDEVHVTLKRAGPSGAR